MVCGAQLSCSITGLEETQKVTESLPCLGEENMAAMPRAKEEVLWPGKCNVAFTLQQRPEERRVYVNEKGDPMV